MFSVDENKIDEVLALINFSDKRIVNRILHLVKKYNDIDVKLNEKYAELDKIEDELDKSIALSDLEINILEEFKKDVNEAFGMNIVDEIYRDAFPGNGDVLPGIEEYFRIFDRAKPFIEDSKKQESIAISELNKLYSLDRIK